MNSQAAQYLTYFPLQRELTLDLNSAPAPAPFSNTEAGWWREDPDGSPEGSSEDWAKPGTCSSNHNNQHLWGSKITLPPWLLVVLGDAAMVSSMEPSKPNPGSGSHWWGRFANPWGTAGKQQGGRGVQACVSAQGKERALVRSDWVYWVTTEALPA